MTRARGRPRQKQRELVDRVVLIADTLAANPELPANEILRQIGGGRRSDVLRVVKAIQGAMSAVAAPGRQIGSQKAQKGRPAGGTPVGEAAGS